MAIILGKGFFSKEDALAKGYTSWQRFWHNVGFAVTFKWLKKKEK